MAKLVTVTLDPESSQIDVDTEGFHGKGCGAIHDAFKTLGTLKKEIHKPEFHQTTTNLQRK